MTQDSFLDIPKSDINVKISIQFDELSSKSYKTPKQQNITVLDFT